MLPTFIHEKETGRIYINPAKRHVKPYWLVTDPVTIALGANATSNPIPMLIDTQGHYEIFYSMFQSTGDFTINIFDPGTRRFLMNREIHNRTIAGTARRPHIWPESYFMNVENAQRSLLVTFRDLSGNPNNIRFTLVGRRFYHKESPPEIQAKMTEFFNKKERTNVYFLTTDDPIALLANATATFDIRTTDEADTEIFKLMSVQDGIFEFDLLDASTGRTFMNGLIRQEVGFGDNEFPFILPESLVLERNYRLQARITDLSGAPNNIFLTFGSRRLYYV